MMLYHSLLNPAKLSLIVLSLFLGSQSITAQQHCLTPDEVKKMLAQVSAPTKLEVNKKLREELLKFKEKVQEQLNEDIRENRKPEALIKRIRASREKHTSQLCGILKKHGWPTASQVGNDGVEAAFFVLRDSAEAQLKIDLAGVILSAAKAGEIPRPDFAGYLDRLRLDAGLKQLFGTQATILDGFLVLFPIEAEAQVDARRKQYELPPLSDYLRFLQMKYQLPLVKSTGALTNRFSDKQTASIALSSDTLLEGQAVAEDDVVRVDTRLVSLNVSVFSNKLRAHVNTLSQKDFAVSEDGRQETITYFATTDVPFDLVLLIDLSGSTAGKRNLIRQSTQRFIEATRPSDRVAIVTFSSTTNVIAPLTSDRAKLMESALAIGDEKGGSHVWDALKFTLDEVLGPTTLDRRRAVVFMTDGVDNALYNWRQGSKISFADLLEAVRRNDSLIVPIFLDTENDEYNSFSFRSYESARKTLARLADESGGLYYKAKRIEDLDGVYTQVIEDLGKVYSLGYKPTNEARDGKWRSVKIELPNLPDLKTRTRPGYYAN